MTDSIYRGDEESLLPEPGVTIREDYVDKEYSLTITNLTEQQFNTISAGVIQAMNKDPRSRVGKFVGKALSIAVLMVFLAAAVRLIVWILSGLAINA